MVFDIVFYFRYEIPTQFDHCPLYNVEGIVWSECIFFVHFRCMQRCREQVDDWTNEMDCRKNVKGTEEEEIIRKATLSKM